MHPYVSVDKKKTFCIYDAPAPEVIRRTAVRNKLPVTAITESPSAGSIFLQMTGGPHRGGFR